VLLFHAFSLWRTVIALDGYRFQDFENILTFAMLGAIIASDSYPFEKATIMIT
jgi:hypothetical protein